MIRRLLYLARDGRLALAITLLTGLLAGLLTIAQASFLSQAIDRVFLGRQALPDLAGLLRLLLLIFLLRGGLVWAGEVSASTLAVRVKGDLRQRLFDKIVRLGPAYTRRERTGELVNAAVEGVEALDAWFSQYLPQLVLAALVPFSILLFVFPRDPVSGLILLFTAPLIPIFMYLVGAASERLTKRQWDTLGRLSAHFFDSLQGLQTLKEFGRSRAQAAAIDEASRRFRDVTLGVLRLTFLSALVLELVATISTALVAVEVGLRLLYGHLSFQPALFLLLLAPEFYIPLRLLGLRFHAGMAGTTAVRRIFEVLDAQEAIAPGAQISGEGVPLGPKFSSLAFSSVVYAYPGESEPVLSDLSFEVKEGEHVALVGTSGVGKSTIAALLLRFIAPQGGRLTIDQVTSSQVPVDDWRKSFAWVPQNPYLFHDTIAANLRLAKPAASQIELEAAARLAHLDRWIASLPQAYETLIGEQGARLSAGQAQRLALARAYLKNAPILILDEPTSNLDPEQEALVESTLRTIKQDRTIITIAHRLNTAAQADRILVLEGGRIVESGSHRELLAQSGTYVALVKPASVEDQRSEMRPGLQPSILDQPPVTSQLSIFNPQSEISNQKSKVLLRLLSFLNGSWGWVSLSVVLGVLTVGSNVGLMGTSAFLISAAALHPELGTLQVAIVGVRFFGITRGVFRYLERLTSHNVTFRLLARLRVWFYQRLEPLAPARLMQYRSGDLLGRIISDVGTLENFYVRLVSPALGAILTALGMSFFFFHYSASLGWIYLAFLLLLGLALPLLAFALSQAAGTNLVERRALLQAHLADGLQGLPELLAFGREADYALVLKEAGRLHGRSQRHLAFISGLSGGLTVLLTNLGMLAVFVLAIPLVRSGLLPGVMLAVLTLAAAAGFEAVLPLPQAAQTLASSTQAARRLFEIVDAEPIVKDSPGSITPKPISSSSILPALVVSSLSITYPGQSCPALQNVSFRLEPGKRLAIVGPSGAGKSTLANLLLRFWEYSQGKVTLGGYDLHNLPQEQVRKFYSVLSQRLWFSNDTLRNNLLLAQPYATQEMLEQAARAAQIHNFILTLPQGYDTFIGERGFRLSGGERQRLAMARLLLKGAPILLLDEPTANLDPLTERRILDSLFSLGREHSLLLITHRLVGLDAVDEILVLERGCITERGTHTTLLAAGGLYARMWELQQRVLEASK